MFGNHSAAALFAPAIMISSAAIAQPQVPPGFTARQIAPLLDGVRPQLSAIDDPGGFGVGVVTAAAGGGVLTIRVIEPSGVIRTLGAFADPSDQLFAQRVRLDAAGVVDGRLHCSLRIRGGTGEGETAYITLQPGGSPVEEWRRTDLVVFDFEFVQGEPGLGDGAVMLDTDGDGDTLAITLAPSPSTSTIATASPTPSRFRRTSTNRRSIAAPCRLRRRFEILHAQARQATTVAAT